MFGYVKKGTNQMNAFRVTVALLLMAGLWTRAGVANAGVIYTSNPQGAWNHYFQQGGPGANNPAYFPTSLADVANATFTGMVVYNSVDTLTGMGAFGPEYNQPGSTYQVFTTFVTSATDQTIRLGLAGDDGHSLFVNDSFVTGAGFGGTGANPNAIYDLPLTAGVEVQLTLVGHDAYGSSWIIGITDPQTYPGVTINANPLVNVVPEPTSLVLFGVAVIFLGLYTGAWHRVHRCICSAR